MLDLLIIGAGLTGLTAAYHAAKQGLTVKIIAKGLGSMHWTAGTIDLIGYANKKAVKRPFDALPAFTKAHPRHPYARLSAAQIRGAMADFLAMAQEMGLPYGGCDDYGSDGDNNLWLPSPAGAARPAFLAPQAQIGGALSSPQPMLIVGFKGMVDFYPELIASNLSKQATTARAAFLPPNTITDRHVSTSIQLAQALDDPARRQRLTTALKTIARPGERIGLPAILGLNDHAAALADLEREMKTAVFEIPTLPPSVPGARLFTAIRALLERMGVQIEIGMEAIGAKTAPDRTIKWVETETSARPLRHRARRYLLATGGLLGGGLIGEMDGRVRETIFNLPVVRPASRQEWFNRDFLAPQGHAIFNGGIAVNEQFQPVDENGAVCYANLYAAGSTLAYCDPILERSMEGLELVTGKTAVKAML